MHEKVILAIHSYIRFYIERMACPMYAFCLELDDGFMTWEFYHPRQCLNISWDFDTCLIEIDYMDSAGNFSDLQEYSESKVKYFLEKVLTLY